MTNKDNRVPPTSHLQVPCHVLHMGWKITSFCESSSRVENIPTPVHMRNTTSWSQQSSQTYYIQLGSPGKGEAPHLPSNLDLVPFLMWKPRLELERRKVKWKWNKYASDIPSINKWKKRTGPSKSYHQNTEHEGALDNLCILPFFFLLHIMLYRN